jgi:hypothetical protein
MASVGRQLFPLAHPASPGEPPELLDQRPSKALSQVRSAPQAMLMGAPPWLGRSLASSRVAHPKEPPALYMWRTRQ